MASGVRDISVVFGSRISLLFFGLASQSCLAWVLGPAERGAYAVCMLFSTLLALFFVVGCDIASVYFVSSKRFSISEGIAHTVVYGGIGSGMAVIAGLVIMQLPISFLDKATPGAFYLALVSIPFSLFAFIFVRLLTALHQFGWFAIISVLAAAVQLLLTALFVWFFKLGVKGALAAIIISNTITIIVTLVFFYQQCGLTWIRPSLKSLLGMFHYGARYYVGKIGNNINFQIGTMVLALFSSKIEIGLFAVASQVVVRTMLVPDALTVVLMPKVARDKTGKKELVAQCARLVAVVSTVLMLILAVFAKPIVSILFSPAFLPVATLVRILAVGVVVRSACKIFVPYLLGTDRPGIASISTIVGATTNLGVLWWLLPALGLPGAAIAMVAGYFAGSILLTLGFSRLSGLGLREIWQFKRADFELVANAVKSVHRKILSKQNQ